MSDIVVLIATAGRPALLRRTLASIAECRIPERYASTLVVENGGKQGSEEVVADFADSSVQAQYAYREEAGVSKAYNFALRGLDERTLVVFADDDILVQERWLEAYDAASTGIEEGEFYGGPFKVDYEQKPPEWLESYLPASALGKSAQDDWRLDPVGFKGFLGFNWSAFVGDLRAAGGFDENLGPGTGAEGSEKYLQRRLLGKKVQPRLVPEAKVWHYVPRKRCAPEWALGRAYSQGRSKGLMFRRGVVGHNGRSGREMVARWGRSLYYAPYFKLKEKVYSRGARPTFDSRYRYQYHKGFLRGLMEERVNRTTVKLSTRLHDGS